MQTPLSLTFRDITPWDALEADIRQRIDNLETYHQPILGARVLVELAERHHATGNRYHVRVDLSVPGEDIVVKRDASLHASARDLEEAGTTKQDEVDSERKHVYTVVRQAFDAARRQLQDYTRRQRGAVKTPVGPPRGRVVRLFPDQGYGFIEAEDGHEVYFHRNSVLKGAFDQLSVGSAVSFAEEQGDKGPQASTVRLSRPRRARRTTDAQPSRR